MHQQPLSVYYGDFNADEKIDPILCYSAEGKEYPLASRDEMLGQLTSLRKKFKTYDSYARATIQDILEPAQLAQRKEAAA